MAYLAVNEDNSEWCFNEKPIRFDGMLWGAVDELRRDLDEVELPQGSIKKLIGYKLTWEDEPVEI